MSPQTIELLGTVLLYFLWQGAALGALLWVGISFSRDARVRYGLAVSTLVLMAACPFATLLTFGKPAVAITNAGAVPLAPAVLHMTVALSSPAPLASIDWLTCLVWVWCSGVLVFGMRALGGCLVLQRLRHSAQESLSPVILERCVRLQRSIGIDKLVRFADSPVVDAPAVLGWFRPVVLLPLSAMAGLSVEQLEAVIAHELAHIKRYDALVNLFQIAVETLLFYHPAVWWVNRLIRMERENCCDDIAVSVCGNAHEYARALAAMGGAQKRPSWAMAANAGSLKDRVARLLGLPKVVHGVSRAGLVALAILCASCIVAAGGAFRQEAPTVLPVAPETALLADNSANQVRELERKTAEADNTQLTRETAAEARELARSLRRLEHLQRQLPELAELTSDRPDDLQQPSSDAKPDQPSGPSFIDSLAAAGLTNLSADDLIVLKIQGVTGEYVREMKAAGVDPTVHELLALRIQGVTPEYVRDIRATGIKPTAREFTGLKIQGVTPELIHALQSAGFANLAVHEYMAAKIQGITPEFIEKVRSHGFKDLTFHQLLNLKIAGVF